MTASKGDFIIKGIKGEFYPCKPDIFEQTYDEVQNDNRNWEILRCTTEVFWWGKTIITY